MKAMNITFVIPRTKVPSDADVKSFPSLIQRYTSHLKTY